MRTKILVLLALVLLVLTHPEARAQNTRSSVFVAPAGISSGGDTARAYHVGGGVERMLERGFGAGADVVAVLPGQGKIKDTVGILALNLYHHPTLFRARPARAPRLRTEPFVTVGYSLLFRDFTSNLFSFGGGINYWLEDNHGLLLEFRDNVGQPRNGPTTHYWAVRIGMSFR